MFGGNLFNAKSRDLSETVPTGEFIANLTVVDRRVVATSGLIIHPHPGFGAPEFVAADRSGMPGLQISVQRSEHARGNTSTADTQHGEEHQPERGCLRCSPAAEVIETSDAH